MIDRLENYFWTDREFRKICLSVEGSSSLDNSWDELLRYEDLFLNYSQFDTFSYHLNDLGVKRNLSGYSEKYVAAALLGQKLSFDGITPALYQNDIIGNTFSELIETINKSNSQKLNDLLCNHVKSRLYRVRDCFNCLLWMAFCRGSHKFNTFSDSHQLDEYPLYREQKPKNKKMIQMMFLLGQDQKAKK